MLQYGKLHILKKVLDNKLVTIIQQVIQIN